MTVIEKPELTDSEKRALKAFRVARKRAGGWPELQEIADEMSNSKQRVDQLMKSLCEKGRLQKVGRYRGYREIRKAA